MDASESSQDVPAHFPSSHDESLTQDVADSVSISPPTVNPLHSSTRASIQRSMHSYGLLGETPAAPFNDEVWKDWVLTPLELRHSPAPKEDEYADFPLPGPLPIIPCAVRFDIIKRYPSESLSTLGCARSDVSNGWVVTHSKTLLLDATEAARFIDAIRYRANEIEVTGDQKEDTLRLQFNYTHTFEQTVFEHPWLLDLQRRYRSSYSLKSTLSEYDDGENLPRGSLTHNGSWNHRTYGELTENAGFIRTTKETQPELAGVDAGIDDESRSEGRGEEERRRRRREEKKKSAESSEAFDISSTRPPSMLKTAPSPLPRSYMMRIDSPTHMFDSLNPQPLDDPSPLEKQRFGHHEGLERITEIAARILDSGVNDDEVSTPDKTLSPKLPPLLYPETDDELPKQLETGTIDRRTPSIHPHPIFPAILPPNALHPGGTFIELRTDQPDIWGFNDYESTVVRLQSAPIQATAIEAPDCAIPSSDHPLWNEVRGRIERIRTMKIYDGDVHQYNLICKAEHYTDFIVPSAHEWLDDGDLTIGIGVAEVCVRAQYEYVHPSSSHAIKNADEFKRVSQCVDDIWESYNLPRTTPTPSF
ncbi:hypothetical protein EYR36_007698 [Pleurotus pulmonarius]|nr:hypothetical protein EYR36_007698 [Pleurotus pulmonarius]